MPTPGGPDELDRLVRQIASGHQMSGISRVLFAIRWKLGALLGWDKPGSGIGARVQTLRDRLPADLRDAPRGPDFGPFRSVYQLDNEWAAELANSTVHGVMHIGWVPDGVGGYRGQMTVLVKPNGLFGAAYMAAIAPFRYLIVYPALMRTIERRWRSRTSEVAVSRLSHARILATSQPATHAKSRPTGRSRDRTNYVAGRPASTR